MTVGVDVHGFPIDPSPDNLRALLRDQMIVTLLRRLLRERPGTLRVAATEIDANGDWAVAIDLVGPNFVFHLERKP